MVYDLKLSGQVNPLGVDGPCDFSWLVKTTSGADQASYRVRVAHTAQDLLAEKDLVWDSDTVAGDETNNIAFGGELEAFATYAWNVEVTYADGAVEKSDVATFECGPLTAADWDAQWVSSPFERHGEYFVTEFIEEGNFDDTVNKDDLNAPSTSARSSTPGTAPRRTWREPASMPRPTASTTSRSTALPPAMPFSPLATPPTASCCTSRPTT